MHNILTADRPKSTSVPMRRFEVAQPVVVVISDDPQLALSLEVVCDFLELSVECVASADDIGAVLASHRPMAVITEMDCRQRDGYNVMMAVAAFDRNMPVMLLTDHDSMLDGAADAIEELWGLSSVTRSRRAPNIGELVDFFFVAGRKTGSLRLIPV